MGEKSVQDEEKMRGGKKERKKRLTTRPRGVRLINGLYNCLLLGAGFYI